MYVHKISDSKPAFTGMKINGIVSPAKMKEAGEFLSRFENIDFVTNLEKTFDTDMVLSSDLTKISFVHKDFGNLEKFGAKERTTQNYLSIASDIFRDVKSAVTKAQKNAQNNETDKFIRGC